jgi:hypothetical protein
MPVGALHSVEHLVDEYARHVLVEQVAHGINEYHAGLAPAQGLLDSLWPQRQIEAKRKGMARNAAKPLREALGVAVIAPATDLSATRYRVPGHVSPFDCATIGHFSPQISEECYRILESFAT